MADEQANRELDARIAVEVMGKKLLSQDEMIVEAERQWKWQPQCQYFHMGFMAHRTVSGKVVCQRIYPKYSTDWSAAGEVLVKVMHDHHNTFAAAVIETLAISKAILPHQIASMPHRIVGELLSKLTPLAICSAGLAAVEKTETAEAKEAPYECQ